MTVRVFAAASCAALLIAAGCSAPGGGTRVLTASGTTQSAAASPTLLSDTRSAQSTGGCTVGGKFYVISGQTIRVYATTGSHPLLVAATGIAQAPDGIAIDAAANTAYVLDYAQGVHLAHGSDCAAHPSRFGAFAYADQGIALDPVAQRVYVSSGTAYAPGAVTVFPMDNGYEPTATITDVVGPASMTVDVSAQRLYVADQTAQQIDVFSTSAGYARIAAIPIGSSPMSVDVDSGRGALYVVDGSGNILVYSTAPGYPRISTISLAQSAFLASGVAVDAINGLFYVSSVYANSVRIYREAPGYPIAATVANIPYPRQIAVSP